MSSEGRNKIRLSGVGVVYGSEVAVRGVDLDIPAKQITGWIGPSGCGKSSLLAAINRMTDMVTDCRVDGVIQFDGLNVLDQSTDLMWLRRRVGMIFQKPNPFPVSIRKNLELPLREHGLRDRKLLAEKIEKVLQEAGLWDEVKDRLGDSALGLSGGQQQRLCIARALALEPEVILLDEPCSSLDPLASGVVEDLIVSLKGRATIVLVSHDIAQARRIADRIAIFWYEDGAGRLVEVCEDKQQFENSTNPITRCFIDGTRC
jgi:phosphate transport system ATP-binding protein